jgi:HAD superfamily hydrolase (TIGR01509 family)
MIRALLFDFDGLILDTETPTYEAWQSIYSEHNADLPLVVWATIIGTSEEAFNPLDYLEQQIGRSVDRSAIRADHERRCMTLINAQPPMPGVTGYITTAQDRGLKLGLASSSSCAWVTGHLDRLGLLDHFDCIRGSDDVERVKPDPALYRSALDALALESHEAVVLEDSPNGILAASRAGAFCVAVPNRMTRDLRFEGADLRLESLADMSLADLLDRVAALRR